MERSAVHVMGPLPVTKQDNRYLLVAMDFWITLPNGRKPMRFRTIKHTQWPPSLYESSYADSVNCENYILTRSVISSHI